MLNIETISVTPVRQNCRILHDEQGNCVVLDPGGDTRKIIAKLEELKITPAQVWLTHSHFDHCGGVTGLRSKYDFKLYGHKAGAEMRTLVLYARDRFGLRGDDSFKNCPEPDVYLEEGEQLFCGEYAFDVLFVPGHAPDHLVFHEKNEQILLAGDTLFAGSIGRTDLPGGNHQLLIEGIRNKILTMPDNTNVYCGHGENTTIAIEKETNPFFN